jgi:hypothetical protein
MSSLVLYRGFVVSSLNDLLKRGFAIGNPREDNFVGETGFPRDGFSFGYLDGFSLAKGIAGMSGGIPVCGRIELDPPLIAQVKPIGVRRILRPEGGFTPGTIDTFTCSTLEQAYEAGEFVIQGRFLMPDWIIRMRGAVSLSEGNYIPFGEFKKERETELPFWERIRMRF